MNRRRLRILFIADPDSIHTKRWVGWFARRHDVLLASVYPPNPMTWTRTDIPLAPAINARSRPVRALKLAVQLRRLLHEFRPDFVHAHFLAPNAWFATATGFPRVVTTTWGGDLLLASSWQKPLNTWSLRRAVLNTADSEAAIDRLVQIVGGTARVRLIQFGVDTEMFAPATPSGEIRRSWNIPADARLLVSPRILRPLYNGRTIARAFAAIAPSIPNLQLAFLAYHADADYQREVEGELRASGLMSRARFVPSVPHQLMPELYREADVVLSVPSSDTTPVTLLEAMATGCVAVASDLPSVREWITPGENGFLVAPGNSRALAEAIKTALELSTEERAAMLEVNRKLVVSRASQDAEMTRMEELLYQELGVGNES